MPHGIQRNEILTGAFRRFHRPAKCLSCRLTNNFQEPSMKAERCFPALLALLTFFTFTLQAQWVQLTGPEGADAQDFLTTGSALLVATDGAGSFRSLDSGATWAASNSGLGNLQVYCLASDSGKILAGTSYGIWRSQDDAQNWTKETGTRL